MFVLINRSFNILFEQKNKGIYKMSWKPFIDLNHWYMRKSKIFNNWEIRKMVHKEKTWYVIGLYFIRIGIEIERVADIPEALISIASKYKASVQRDVEHCEDNHGTCAGRDIWLGRFDDPGIETVAFFHELGHVLSSEIVCKRGRTMTKLSSEGLAWELGLGIAFEHGYEWDRDGPVMIWAREQLKTYCSYKNCR